MNSKDGCGCAACRQGGACPDPHARVLAAWRSRLPANISPAYAEAYLERVRPALAPPGRDLRTHLHGRPLAELLRGRSVELYAPALRRLAAAREEVARLSPCELRGLGDLSVELVDTMRLRGLTRQQLRAWIDDHELARPDHAPALADELHHLYPQVRA